MNAKHRIYLNFMIFNKKIKNLLTISLLSCVATSAIAEETDEIEEQPQWYQVEVVLFKSASMAGLNKEAWQVNEEIIPPKNMVDFLQSYRLIPGDPLEESVEDIKGNSLKNQSGASNNQKNLVGDSNKSGIDTNTSAKSDSNTNGIANDGSVASASEESLLIEEKPFVLLNEDLLKLNNEVTALQRHPEYKVISHLGWRQPILGASDAPHIRIAGGQDFSLEYTHKGEKRLPYYESEDTVEDSNNLNQIDNSGFATNSLDAQSSAINQQNNMLSKETHNSEEESLPVSDQIVPELWVPEIDGDIQVYLSRYLHVKTNLFLRRPDKEEVEAVDLTLFPGSDLNSFNQETATDNSSTGNLSNSIFGSTNTENSFSSSDLFKSNEENKASSNNPLDANGLLSNPKNPNNILSNTNISINGLNNQQFSWEIGDDFLDTESEKMYIEKLFNYPLRQSRRMRSTELHYFDHPLFGMLIMITPYEPNGLQSELQLEGAR